MSKFIRSLVGATVGAVVDLLIHFVAAGFLKNTSVDQFIGSQGIWILVALIVLGLVIGFFFEKSEGTSSKDIKAKNLKTKGSQITLTRRGEGGGIDISGGNSENSVHNYTNE